MPAVHFPAAAQPPIGYPIPHGYPFPQQQPASPTRAQRWTSQELLQKTGRLKPEDQEWFLQKMVDSRFQYATASDSAKIKFFEDLAREARETRGLVLYGTDVRNRIHHNLCSERRLLLDKGQLPSRGPDDNRLLFLQDKWNKMVRGVVEQTPASYTDERELGRLEALATQNLLRHFDVLRAGDSDEDKRLDAEAAIAILLANDVKSIIPFNTKTRLAASMRSNCILSQSVGLEEEQTRKKQSWDSSVEQAHGPRKRRREEYEDDNKTSDTNSESIEQNIKGTSTTRGRLEGLVSGRAGAATNTAQWVQAHGSSQPITPASLVLESRESLEAPGGAEVAVTSVAESSSAEQSQVAERLETVSIQDEGGDDGGMKKKGLHELAAMKRRQNEEKKRKNDGKKVKDKEKEDGKKKKKNTRKDKKTARPRSN
ncbi:hypothetical protein PgNI_05220 [Pyricularia grisea]|uniref:Uncharacterized protein n=1 Tax=Pyricularia grisea TaxID=148305 RepID=A0A6P8B3I4_PYRGI|nr:hypothetical protein PgNI_05220 [Pyricularia grisea]TLD09867.1 hypothetical protein PgNI_05220 [Pyricularia grisea]